LKRPYKPVALLDVLFPAAKIFEKVLHFGCILPDLRLHFERIHAAPALKISKDL
jgi:hypothetical protein